MSIVTSRHNAAYKFINQLANSPKHRRRYKQTIIEGVHLGQSYLQSGGVFKRLVVAEAAWQNPEIQQILHDCQELKIEIMTISQSNFRALSSVEHGLGILAVIDIPQQSKQKLQSDALLIDDVQDPGNLGGLLRTAAAAGVRDIFLSTKTASAWAPKTLRAGMGAQFVLNVFEQTDLVQLVSRSTVQVLATNLKAAESVYEFDLTKPTAWIFGNEGQGVSSEVLAQGVKTVVIPQDNQIESLNVAAAAAVCLFEQFRQRHQV